MIEEIRNNLYRIEIPLPRNPLKALNSYFIRGSDKNLLIDTGFNREECRIAMDKAVHELDIDLEETDILITHVHSDHSGLTGYLARPETKIYIDEYAYNSLNQGSELSSYYADFIRQSGLMAMGLPQDLSLHPGYLYRSDPVGHVTVAREGDLIHAGDFTLRCVMTPGHAPDHICLYDQEHKILFSGDHILGGITPNNTIWDSPWEIRNDYLGEYFESLEKVQEMDVELTLPGHRSILTDCRGRIEELKLHHHNRLQNVLDILGNKSMTGAQVASKMKWDLSIKSWENYPPAQKIFAAGEALSHLTHLEFKGVVGKELKDGLVYYHIA